MTVGNVNVKGNVSKDTLTLMESASWGALGSVKHLVHAETGMTIHDKRKENGIVSPVCEVGLKTPLHTQCLGLPKWLDYPQNQDLNIELVGDFPVSLEICWMDGSQKNRFKDTILSKVISSQFWIK